MPFWKIAEGGGSGSGSGDVVGPGSSTAHDVASFADTTGKLLEDRTGVSVSAAGTLTATTAVVVPAGSAAAAGLRVVDAGTGLYQPSAHELGLTVNGTEVVDAQVGTVNFLVPITIQPPSSDVTSLVVRRENSSQTSHVFEVQTELNGFLASIGKSGTFTSNNGAYTTSAGVAFAASTTAFISIGLIVDIFITPTETPSAKSSSAAFSASGTIIPQAIMVASAPFFSTSAFPTLNS